MAAAIGTGFPALLSASPQCRVSTSLKTVKHRTHRPSPTAAMAREVWGLRLRGRPGLLEPVRADHVNLWVVPHMRLHPESHPSSRAARCAHRGETSHDYGNRGVITQPVGGWSPQ